MARFSDPVERGISISIARCRELLAEEAESMTGHDIAMIRRHAESMAWILIDLYEEHRTTTG